MEGKEYREVGEGGGSSSIGNSSRLIQMWFPYLSQSLS